MLIGVQETRPSLFFFNDTATTEIHPLSLPDALPIFSWGDLPGITNVRATQDRQDPSPWRAPKSGTASKGLRRPHRPAARLSSPPRSERGKARSDSGGYSFQARKRLVMG